MGQQELSTPLILACLGAGCNRSIAAINALLGL